jgi:hypothetical protein
MTASGGSEGLQDDETALDEIGEDEPRELQSRVSLYVFCRLQVTPPSTM